MKFSEILTPQLCSVLKEKTKNEVLISLIELIAKEKGFSAQKKESVVEKIFFREQLMSTGIGLGIGIPHIRYEGVEGPVIAVGVRNDGIENYSAIDNVPVTVVVMIIVGKDQHKQHIRLLSQVVNLLKNEEIQRRLLAADTADDIYNIIAGEPNA